MARSLNRVQLIGNLTRDPELRYTANGTAVCSFGLATNRSWTTDKGEKREEADFHKVVAWGKLAELCSQFLLKGRKVYVEGRLSTRAWQAQDGAQRTTTEVVINDMILLDYKRGGEEAVQNNNEVSQEPQEEKVIKKEEKAAGKKGSKGQETVASEENEEVSPDDIPF